MNIKLREITIHPVYDHQALIAGNWRAEYKGRSIYFRNKPTKHLARDLFLAQIITGQFHYN